MKLKIEIIGLSELTFAIKRLVAVLMGDTSDLVYGLPLPIGTPIPSRQVKPKFKVGDTIVGKHSNGTFYSIKEIKDGCYHCAYAGEDTNIIKKGDMRKFSFAFAAANFNRTNVRKKYDDGTHGTRWIYKHYGITQKETTNAAKKLGIKNHGTSNNPRYYEYDVKMIAGYLKRE